MTAAEIANVVRQHVDKTVRVTYENGETQELFVHMLDDEGFVCYISSEMARPPACAYWVRFTDLSEARSAE